MKWHVLENPARCFALSRCSVSIRSSSLLFPTYSRRMGQWPRGSKECSKCGGKTKPRPGRWSCRPGQGAVSSPRGGLRGVSLQSEAHQESTRHGGPWRGGNAPGSLLRLVAVHERTWRCGIGNRARSDAQHKMRSCSCYSGVNFLSGWRSGDIAVSSSRLCAVAETEGQLWVSCLGRRRDPEHWGFQPHGSDSFIYLCFFCTKFLTDMEGKCLRRYGLFKTNKRASFSFKHFLHAYHYASLPPLFLRR